MSGAMCQRSSQEKDEFSIVDMSLAWFRVSVAQLQDDMCTVDTTMRPADLRVSKVGLSQVVCEQLHY